MQVEPVRGVTGVDRVRHGAVEVDQIAHRPRGELAEVEPDKVTITKRLEEVKERMEGAIKALEAGGKLGKVLVKAAPVVAALLKLAQTVF